MTRDEALKKIKKCLALARSANEHEAGSALRQAQKLMEQFGLCEQDVSLADVIEVRVKACSTAANTWELRLVGLVANAFGCEVFASLDGRYTGAGNYVRTRHWCFVGIDAAATVAGYACEVLLRQCVRARLAHIAKQPKNCKPVTKTARGDGFALGWVAGASEKVKAFTSPAGDKALLLAYIKREYGELDKGRARDTTTGRNVAGHLMAGFRAGQNAQLHHGVGGMPAQGVLT